MPEYTELYASYWLANHFVRSVQPECPLLLQAIIVDATDTEQARSPSHSLAHNGFPYPLVQGAKVPRGSKGSQNNIYPPISCNIPDACLKLEDVFFHPRSLILRFDSSSEDVSITGEWWMQVQMLTHTVVQVYTASDFHERICKVPKKTRGFRIAIALDLGQYVMAFLSLDNMFGVWYSRTRSGLDAPSLDIYTNFEQTLTEFIGWLDSRKKLDRSGLAISVVRKSAHRILVGLGVYTASEVFHRAGLLPTLTEAEVFDSPSRCARFLEAFFSHASQAHLKMGKFLLPYLQQGGSYFLAVHNEDRLDYAQWLQVYAKDRTWLSARHRTQYDELKRWLDSSIQQGGAPIVRSMENGWFDPHEPSLIAAGLEKKKNLGHIIYGKAAWAAAGGEVWEDCPLDAYYQQQDILSSPQNMFLHPMFLPSPLTPSLPSSTSFVLPSSSLLKSWTNSYLYNTNDKSFWCAMGNLPGNTQPYSRKGTEVEQPHLTIALPEQRKKELFENVVLYSKGYAVGPLDYCGIARIHRKKVALCQSDPAQSDFFKTSLEASFDRRRHLKIGKQKTANPNAVKRKRALNEAKENIPESKQLLESPQKPQKRRRLSADKQLLQSVN